jgi:hypothetical protein
MRILVINNKILKVSTVRNTVIKSNGFQNILVNNSVDDDFDIEDLPEIIKQLDSYKMNYKLFYYDNNGIPTTDASSHDDMDWEINIDIDNKFAY